VSDHRPINKRLRRMVMDGLDVSTIQDEPIRADLAKEYLATRRFYAKSAIIVTLLICFTLVLAILIFGYQVQVDIISACQEACAASGSLVSEVTSQRCVCEPLE